MRTFIRAVEVWVPDAGHTLLEWGGGLYPDAPRFGAVSRTMCFGRAEGLPGQAWDLGRPIVLKQFEGSYFLRARAAAAEGLTCGIALPFFHGESLSAVMVVFCGDNASHAGAIELWHSEPEVSPDMTLDDGYYGTTAEVFEFVARQTAFRKGFGLPGLAWDSGLPVFMPDLGKGTRFIRADSAVQVGINRGLAIPCSARGSGVWVMAFLSALGTPIVRRVETWLGPLQAARSLQFAQPGPASDDGIGPAHGGFFIETGPAHPGLAASALPWDGGQAGRNLMRAFPFIVPLGAALRDSSAGRVRWSRAHRPRIDYQLADADRRTVARAKVELSRLGRAAGALELLTAGAPSDRIDLERASDAEWEAFLRRRVTGDYGPNRVFAFSAHQMGTARAGGNPRASVCDPEGRVRSDQTWAPIGGLYVADTSLFPSAAGVNPMLTVMALAERTARAVLTDSAPAA